MNAPDKADEIKAGIVAILALLTSLWGWVGWAVFIWLGCIMLDYLSGSAAAKAAGEWSSQKAREGLWHKLGEIFAVLVAALCDIALNVVLRGSGVALPIDIGPLVTPVVLLWYIITELGSIVENAGKLGAPVPAWLRKSLAEYKDKIDHDQGGDGPKDEENSAGKHEKPPDGDPYKELKAEMGCYDEDPTV